MNIHDIAAVALKKTIGVQKFTFVCIQRIDSINDFAVSKRKADTLVLSLNIFDTAMLNTMNGISASDHNAARGLLQFSHKLVQNTVKNIIINRLQQIVISFNSIGLYRKLWR